MAKKTSVKRSSSPRRTSPADLQRQIARIDRELLQLVNERAKLTVRAAKSAEPETERTSATATDQTTLEQIVAGSKGPLDEQAVRAVFRELYSGARRLVKATRVAYLGPAYSYSHQAAIERFGSSVDLAPVASIAAVFEEVNRGHADYGLVPIENSTDGRIVDTLDMFARKPANICGEIQLRIHHNLLARCGRGDVTEVYSKPQALSQCREWLTKHLPFARLVEMTSTTAAAQLAADKYGAAAIASLQAAANYGLDVVAANIEDNRNNITRFAVIGKDIPKRTSKDKTSAMFEIPHRPGSLADTMAIFKRARLNLTWIESFPLAGSRNEYLFFIELEGHRDEAKVKRALEALGKKTVRLDVLGSYPRANLLE